MAERYASGFAPFLDRPGAEADRGEFAPGLMPSAFDAAAARVAGAARPRGGRTEGKTTMAIEAPGKVAAHLLEGMRTLPQRSFEAATRYGETGEYDPATALEAAMLVTGGRFPFAGPGEIGLGGGRAAVAPKAAPAPAAPAVISREGGARPASDFLINPKRTMYPGIYKDPRVIAEEAGRALAPESPALKSLWGVTRPDIFEMAIKRGPGDLTPPSGFAAKPKPSESAASVMTDANAQRLIDAMAETDKRYPGVTRPSVGWYVQDPIYERMMALAGDPALQRKILREGMENPKLFVPPEATKRILRPEDVPGEFQRFIGMQGAASPASNVMAEINRGTGANWLANKGRFEDFARYGGSEKWLDEAIKTGLAPSELAALMQGIPGHLMHKSQYPGMQRMLETGEYATGKPGPIKADTYIRSHGVPETGYSWHWPVGDSHKARASGFADVRGGEPSGWRSDITPGEMVPYAPWFREKVADPLGLLPVPGQAVQWNVFAPQTGVKTNVGAPKLELQAERIMHRAAETGARPELIRDLGILRQAHWGLPGMIGAGAAAGALEGRDQ